MPDCIVIVDWGKHYENNRTRDLKRMSWVPMPIKHDGDGYTELLNHPNGAAHFGAWCALVEVAAKCGNPAGGCGRVPLIPQEGAEHPFGRGILLRDTGEPHDANSLSRITRIAEAVFTEVIPRLASIGWITLYKIPSQSRRRVRESAVENGSKPQEGAGECPMNGMELNGIELKGMEKKEGDEVRTSAPEKAEEVSDAF